MHLHLAVLTGQKTQGNTLLKGLGRHANGLHAELGQADRRSRDELDEGVIDTLLSTRGVASYGGERIASSYAI
jgi:hypothetical protein